MGRFIHWLTYKPYGCGCGKSYRKPEGQQACIWRHALAP